MLRYTELHFTASMSYFLYSGEFKIKKNKIIKFTTLQRLESLPDRTEVEIGLLKITVIFGLIRTRNSSHSKHKCYHKTKRPKNLSNDLKNPGTASCKCKNEVKQLNVSSSFEHLKCLTGMTAPSICYEKKI